MRIRAYPNNKVVDMRGVGIMRVSEPHIQILVRGIAKVACHNHAESALIEPARNLRCAEACR